MFVLRFKKFYFLNNRNSAEIDVVLRYISRLRDQFNHLGLKIFLFESIFDVYLID